MALWRLEVKAVINTGVCKEAVIQDTCPKLAPLSSQLPAHDNIISDACGAWCGQVLNIMWCNRSASTRCRLVLCSCVPVCQGLKCRQNHVIVSLVGASSIVILLFFKLSHKGKNQVMLFYDPPHCRFMDRIQQKQTDPCGPKVQPGPCALIGAGPRLPPQLAIQEPPLISPSEVLKKQCGLSPVQVAVAPVKAMEQIKPGHAKSPTALTSISRPRPTALGTKPAPKPTRISVDASKDIDLIPVCIPGPQSANILPHSPTESSFPLHNPQSPHSPQSFTSQPYLSPTPRLPQPNPSPPSSLSPKPGLSPQSQKTPTSGSLSQSHEQPEKTAGENNEFRWDT